MRENITLRNGRAYKRINRATNDTKRRVPFGHGVLMPVFVRNSAEVGVVIARTKSASALGEIVPATVAETYAETAKPITYLAFPNSKDGKQALNALRDWLDIVEQSFTYEEDE